MSEMSKIKKLRMERGWTQAQLADLLHAKQTSVAYWENDSRNININVLKALSEVFEVSILKLLPDELITESEADILETIRVKTKPAQNTISQKLIEEKDR